RLRTNKSTEEKTREVGGPRKTRNQGGPKRSVTRYMSIGLTQMTQFSDVSSRFAESVDGS
ncbi:hypothetical protein ACH0B5_16460, partial [Ureibacillus sp. 179-F W5.1 NHS]|uniref:hypothetical protein n=1 Tax=Ureibacillus sp. 179-F W5.1 NHS TaxID=3374297 RepID=UPI003878FB1F